MSTLAEAFEAFGREGRAGTQIKADKIKVNKIKAGQGTEGEHQKVKS